MLGRRDAAPNARNPEESVMSRVMCIRLAAVLVTWLVAQEAVAQGLGGTRPVARPGYGYGGAGYYLARQQALQAEREAARQATLERDEASRQAALAQREAARVAAGEHAAAAQREAMPSAASQQARVNHAFDLYKATSARDRALARHQSTMPTDFGAEGHADASADDPAKTGRATLDVRVPADAEVWFNGYRTSLQGTTRGFTTPALEPGKTYAYQVRARWTENGMPVEQTRQVQVRAGERTTVAFPGEAP